MSNEVEKKNDLVVYSVDLKTNVKHLLYNIQINEEGKFSLVDVFRGGEIKVISSVDGLNYRLMWMCAHSDFYNLINNLCSELNSFLDSNPTSHHLDKFCRSDLEKFFNDKLLYSDDGSRWYIEDKYVYEFCTDKYHYVIDYIDSGSDNK